MDQFIGRLNRRRFLEGTAGVAAASALGAGAVWAPAVHAQQSLSFKPEAGAKLRVLTQPHVSTTFILRFGSAV